MTTPPGATAPTMPPAKPEAASPERSGRSSRFGLFFGIVVSALTLGAIVLAIFAPQLTSTPNLQVPAGWQQVYNDNPGNSTGVWNNNTGCSFPAEGLLIASQGTCDFEPTSNSDLSGGVLIDAQLAPAADVSASQDAGILLDGSLLFIITQQGDYEICRDSCGSTDSLSTITRPLASGSTIAWHSDAFVANEMAVLYNADQNTVSFYANGQFVDQISAGFGANPSIALTTSSSGEALFTHVSIYSANAS